MGCTKYKLSNLNWQYTKKFLTKYPWYTVNENLTFSPTDKLTPMVLISGR